ncbi:MAG: type II toxin-antitoxin system VapC family toxin [Gemmatimonadetes bacterium]|nr:type II toxin-antitoxin system VapC family toxin [Gemmatimonadota bacterium]MYG17039.1 type II toxin-antitoxin system VapC family toxin [Gemmatimonadota bacterium]
MPETQWMTLMETADMMKRLPDQVTQMCEDGKLEYYMQDGRYFVSKESIDLFMHPPIDQPEPAIPDSNGTPRRQYGRAPQDIEPSPESSSESQAVNGPDELNAAGGSVPEDDMAETPGRGDEVVEAAEEAQLAEGLEAEGAVTAEDAQPEDDLADESADEPPDTKDQAESEAVQPVDDLAVTDHEETVEDLVEAVEDVQPAVAAEDSGEPDERAAEILADLRAALSRHAREHQAFCDEIAALADALESTLSHDGDKTSELTREISSLLARYTRR